MRTFFLVLFGCSTALSHAADRPNIVWISVEDISSHLGCYGDRNATTPNLDDFAKQGVRYTQAFTCHGVCAPSRTGIITGMYPISLGANHMRCSAALPEHVQEFPKYLRETGYYCTNNSKEDYNFKRGQKNADIWDESSKTAHWKNRPNPDQPFFAVFNLTLTHESKIWPKGWEQVVKDVPRDQLHDPNRIKVPELYPETSAVKEAHARLLDIIMVMDQKVGGYLKEIEDSGLADNTIVIFWSDHGNGFPRAKRWIYDSGTLVPMIARIPEQWRTAEQGEPGSVDDQLINLIDLGPTVLNLVGLDVPEHMHGQPFLGGNLPEPRKYIYGARDRVDERFDMVRSVRDRQFRYVRNFNPWRAALQHINYAETSIVRQDMRRLDAEGRLPVASAQFLHAPRPAEELYDLQADPWEVKNLATFPAYAETLQRLREECQLWQLSVGDAHLIPEILLDEEEKERGSRWDILNSDNGIDRIDALMLIAQTASAPTEADQPALLEAAADKDPAVRWWAMQGLANLGASNPQTTAAIETASKDESSAVRIAAARALHVAGQTEKAVAVLAAELTDVSDFVRHAAISELDEMGAAATGAKDAIKKMKEKKGYVAEVVRHVLAQIGE